ncbi:Lipopolysaccharide export system protein LptC [Candidatus Profftia lariciata]|uniref:LPS export ABC transporter periplasmic protein LptC n=1 Tax=Candidatus Profftia lariciata TaxID=1987921 RepID=UPI001D0170EA|nr:LPS export ABC transporter periplasmic protein LptC [Candidatus Profftia lariciata]UDG81339.1 Lipopolysaccharide export system protein LptC [Candidatus Profftia lariciata]
MSKIKILIILLLIVIALILIVWNVTNKNCNITQITVKKTEPTYCSQHTITMVYDSKGKLSYKLIAENVKYYKNTKTSCFISPMLITYDQNIKPTWSVRANKAKIINNNMLYLYGSVEINSLIMISQLKKITTDNAQVNLLTQEFSSNNKVNLYGLHFTSYGLKMYGNMQNKTAQLMNKVQTYYDIQNKSKNA